MTELLKMENVRVTIQTRKQNIAALDLDHLSLRQGEILALVGETGSGKSMTASAIMQLFPTDKAKISGGRIMFSGRNLLECGEKELDAIRGKEITMIFQDPMTSLNPVFRIGEPLIEIIRNHTGTTQQKAKELVIEALHYVGLPDPPGILRRYPHELSGGQRQRVMIAMAIACKPKLLIADEPSTALDVTIQAQILHYIQKLKEEQGTSVLFITHNLGIVAKMADRIAVMYGGKIVETGATSEIFRTPRHPYTKMLLEAIPRMKQQRDRLPVIGGRIISPAEQWQGCRFANRCPQATAACGKAAPVLAPIGEQQEVACFHPWESGGGR